MILSVTVENFKGIKNEVRLSAIASNKIKRSSNVCSNLDDKNKALKSIAIIGANAAGKSSFLDAIETVQDFLWFPFRRNITKEDSYRNYIDSLSPEDLRDFLIRFDTPELGNQHNTKKNSYTNIIIEIYVPQRENNISGFYTYQLIYDQYYQKCGVKKEVLSFRKSYDSKRLKLLLNENDIIESEAAVSVVYKNNSSFVKNENINYIESFVDEMLFYTTFSKRLSESSLIDFAEENIKLFCKLCSIADNKIKKVTIDYDDNNSKILKFWNSTKSYLYLNDLSDGTVKILGLGCDIINSLENSETLLFDEIDNGLHFSLSRFLIELNNTFKNNFSQIIFTTHSPVLASYLDNDQVYFIETNSESTSLNSIAYAINNKIISKDQKFLRAYIDGLIINNPNTEELVNFKNMIKDNHY